MSQKHVVVVGGGFAGLQAARRLGKQKEVRVTLIDRRNHHLFQPLLYQVAMAGLSPADIAGPIRNMLSKYRSIRVVCGEVTSVDCDRQTVTTSYGEESYDYLLLACGAIHGYFGNENWEPYAPGLKTIEQATEIRRRVLNSFELAELSDDPDVRKRELTFVIVGGGPTGVELAGAIGEMSRFTLAQDFRNIDASSARVILIEAGPRILPMFDASLSTKAMRFLEQLGVQIWTSCRVTKIDQAGVQLGEERIGAATVLWAAGVKASGLGSKSNLPCDRAGRIIVQEDLSVEGYPNVFVAGDQCAFVDPKTNRQLPGQAPVAVQEGRFVAKMIANDLAGQPREPFSFRDKGQMATIGRSRAIVEIGSFRFAGFFAWIVWLVVHIFFLTGFRNRLFVVLSWAWSFLTFRRGARLIVQKEWQSYPADVD
ncbi:NAD(P)/FAD-dependent oxidoreductase [Roseiconus nitratireducens]|uniref:NADH:ubiquinone reductase (non-electrogenic) n=1 Tax=Roseiconus nitratireducens TaxID=2605748 RepID=A0A5M6D6E6_9BACT|nr:NAD(P)/FAD-dependent oxidoreductase [Roseiconus nitratireducens]KAA5542130.1 NAD(P)/FAD-dependent oxidoreductase [Roseiconus nitratireducens]